MSEQNLGSAQENQDDTQGTIDELLREKVDENGYLPDGTKPTYIKDENLAHEAAIASHEDRSLAADHRAQAKTYEGKYSYVDKNRHYDVARAIGAVADLKEGRILGQESITGSPTSPESLNPERARLERLIEIRSEASKLVTALSGDVDDIRKKMASIPPTNAYADYLTHNFHSKTVESDEKYNGHIFEHLKDVTYAQKFGAVHDRYSAQKAGVEMTQGWPNKYSPYANSLENTIELDARTLFVNTSDDVGRVEYAVGDVNSGMSDWTKNELEKLTTTLGNHTNSRYAEIKSPPSIVIGQDKEGKLVAKAYYIVQIGDRSSRNLESVELHDIDNILQIANARLQPVATERAEGQRKANEIDLDAIKAEATREAEERNQQFVKNFKTNAPEYEDVPDDKLHELLQIAATSGDQHKYTTPKDLPAKDRFIVEAMRSKGTLSVVTDSSGKLVTWKNIGPEHATSDYEYDSWHIDGTDSVKKARYKGAPWSFAFGREIKSSEKVPMTRDEIVEMRKRILDLRLELEEAA